MKRTGTNWSDRFDWETDADAKEKVAAQTKPPACENAADFFASDPIGIRDFSGAKSEKQ